MKDERKLVRCRDGMFSIEEIILLKVKVSLKHLKNLKKFLVAAFETMRDERSE